MGSAFKRNWTFILGAILLSIGAGVSTFVPYFIFFYGIPVILFAMGVLLIWISGRTIHTKLIWSLTPIPLFFIYQFYWRWQNTTEPETFLIPSSFRGKVHVVFNESCGTEIKYEEHRRVYLIPKSGLLLTKFNNEFGFIDQRFYFVDSLGNRNEIPRMDIRDFNEEWTLEKNPKEPSRDSLGVFNWGTSGEGEFQDKTHFQFTEFSVSTYRQLSEKFGFQYDKKFDSIQERAIIDCRKQDSLH